MSKRRKPLPLLFIVQDAQTFSHPKSLAETRAISTHVNSRYREWRKTSHRDLLLHHTTNAILTSNPPVEDIVPANDTNQVTDDEIDRFFAEYRDQLMKTSRQWVYGSFDAEYLPKRKEKLRLPEYLIVPRFSRLGSQTLDPFAPDFFRHDPELRSNLFYYIKIIRPFAIHLLEDWSWINNLSQVQSSPVLAYAVAAYASVFLSGSLRGGPGVVLPPPVEKGEHPLWQIPPWLRLQTSCVVELKAILSDPSKVDESCYQAVIFLLRLSILLSDGESGRMHLKALNKISVMVNRENIDADKEMAVHKINIISAFLHSPSTVIAKTRPNKINGRVREVVKLDRKLWTSDREWYTFCAATEARTLTWRADSPSGQLIPVTAPAITRMDQSSQYLPDNDLLEIQRCYQIALFLSIYLNNISFNTAATRVRSNVLEMKSRLSQMDISVTTCLCQCTMFNLLMIGAMATRGFLERDWFIRNIATHYIDVVRIDHVYRLLAEFIDPLHIVYNAVEDTWEEVIKFRSSFSVGPQPWDIPSPDDIYEIENLRPMNYSPDLSKPIELIEVEDSGLDLKLGIV
ncbi:uncharacterized protein A1O9_00235 [Exophiala aquamarina CBS 119918]|uniref:Transcription factor domain-containing protein n=1 Tax=Exophiala aquamarina CBS 119918 TaxID=1182545 RepID=A0A072PSH9_9EURO|nr:uncharacterized protein A1O9_00235 [Exophiala aquamarina CBS 119918]KEF62263.1 hypothetical protein A1O9_00235 [Exophiala aquamarina CBS 119918]